MAGIVLAVPLGDMQRSGRPHLTAVGMCWLGSSAGGGVDGLDDLGVVYALQSVAMTGLTTLP
jgi:hypothetical protein